MAATTLDAATKDGLKIPEKLWHELIPLLQVKIAEEYEVLKEKNRESGIREEEDHLLWMEAFIAYIRKDPRPSLPKRSWVSDNISGVMVIAAILALAFGILGAWGILSAAGDPKLATATSGFLDIAKLFAGTLVGATVASKR
jgi:hypothetical protein